MRFRTEHWVSGGLAVMGALNWGAVGLLGFNPIHSLVGRSRTVERIIYGLVGLSGLFLAAGALRSQGVGPGQAWRQVEERRPVGVV